MHDPRVPQDVEYGSIKKCSSEPATSDISQQMKLGIIHDSSHTSSLRVANPVYITVGSVSPLAGIQATDDRIDRAHGPGTIHLAAEVLIVRRGVLRDKFNLIEASMTLSTGNVTIIDLVCGASLIVVEIGRLGCWLGFVELDVGRTTWVVHWRR